MGHEGYGGRGWSEVQVEPADCLAGVCTGDVGPWDWEPGTGHAVDGRGKRVVKGKVQRSLISLGLVGTTAWCGSSLRTKIERRVALRGRPMLRGTDWEGKLPQP